MDTITPHYGAAREAYTMFCDYCGGSPPPRVPGMDTVTRLAMRIHYGRTTEEAAAREYLYRWRLALNYGLHDSALGYARRAGPSIFGVPHALGM